MNICVFGAASTKISQSYIKTTEELGKEIARRGHNLVFGAGGNGLMGAAARGVKAGGGKVIGVIPEFFRDESIEEIYDNCDELIYTKTMAERKAKMEELADAFVVVPGGIGTFEEFFEVLTLKQLKRHEKPIAIYNIDRFYDLTEAMLFHGMNNKFIRANCQLLYLIFADSDELFDYIEKGEDSFGLSVHDLKDG
jgi:uncharacterized protein (TIGR00730 family)